MGMGAVDQRNEGIKDGESVLRAEGAWSDRILSGDKGFSGESNARLLVLDIFERNHALDTRTGNEWKVTRHDVHIR